MWNLPSPHAKPQISLPVSTCSLLRRSYPNDGNLKSVDSAHGAFLYPIDENVESVIAAHGAENHFIRKHMLAHCVPTAQPFFPHYPIIRIWGMGRRPMAKKSPWPFFTLSQLWGYGGLPPCLQLALDLKPLPFPCSPIALDLSPLALIPLPLKQNAVALARNLAGGQQRIHGAIERSPGNAQDAGQRAEIAYLQNTALLLLL